MGKPSCQVFEKLSSGFIRLQVDSLVLQCPPESFDEYVIFEAPLAVHADPDIPGFEDGGEGFAGKLAPLVGVEYLRGTVFEQSFLECLDTESAIQGVGQPPGENLSGGPIHDRYQVHESLVHRDIGNISRPDLIWFVNGHSPQ